MRRASTSSTRFSAPRRVWTADAQGTVGRQVCFWGGGVDTQKHLPFGTPEEVYQEATERLEIFAQGGGYVDNPVHNIQSQTSAENMLAYFRAVQDFNAGR